MLVEMSIKQDRDREAFFISISDTYFNEHSCKNFHLFLSRSSKKLSVGDFVFFFARIEFL